MKVDDLRDFFAVIIIIIGLKSAQKPLQTGGGPSLAKAVLCNKNLIKNVFLRYLLKWFPS